MKNKTEDKENKENKQLKGNGLQIHQAQLNEHDIAFHWAREKEGVQELLLGLGIWMWYLAQNLMELE